MREAQLGKWGDLFNRFPWDAARGVAFVTGRPHGLVVVDADDAASWSWVLEHLPAVRGVLTRRGGHLHFRHPARGLIGNRSGDRAVVPAPGVRLDVKGLAGLATGPYDTGARPRLAPVPGAPPVPLSPLFSRISLTVLVRQVAAPRPSRSLIVRWPSSKSRMGLVRLKSALRSSAWVF